MDLGVPAAAAGTCVSTPACLLHQIQSRWCNVVSSTGGSTHTCMPALTHMHSNACITHPNTVPLMWLLEQSHVSTETNILHTCQTIWTNDGQLPVNILFYSVYTNLKSFVNGQTQTHTHIHINIHINARTHKRFHWPSGFSLNPSWHHHCASDGKINRAAAGCPASP